MEKIIVGLLFGVLLLSLSFVSADCWDNGNPIRPVDGGGDVLVCNQYASSLYHNYLYGYTGTPCAYVTDYAVHPERYREVAGGSGDHIYCICEEGYAVFDWPVSGFYSENNKCEPVGIDSDGDGFYVPDVRYAKPVESGSPDNQYSAFIIYNVPEPYDQNDDDPDVCPTCPEICDGKDNNGNGQIDEGCPIDNDGDGYFDFEDCDDNDASINPGAEEVCDGIDNNCIDGIDEGDVCPDPEPECCVEEDCGIDYLTGLYCYGGDIVITSHDFSCNLRFCVEDIVTQVVNECEYGCSNSVCLDEPIDPPECCVDEDCGIDYLTGLYCEAGNVVITSHDFSCVLGSCVEDIVTQVVDECDYGCEDSVCLEEDDDDDDKKRKKKKDADDDPRTVIISSGEKADVIETITLSVEKEEGIERNGRIWFWIILILALLILIVLLFILAADSRS